MSRFAPPSFLFADDPLSEQPSQGTHNSTINASLLRVDPLGVVHYDKPAAHQSKTAAAAKNASSRKKGGGSNKGGVGGASTSQGMTISESDEDGDDAPAGTTLGGLYRMAAAPQNPMRPQNNASVSVSPKLVCHPVPFLRPKTLPKNATDARRFAPPGLCHSTAVGFESEDSIVLFGGALQDAVTPTNDTWIYQVSDRRWTRLDTLEIAPETLQQVRRRRGLSGDILPAPRSGHCAVAIRDTVLDQPIALQYKNRNKQTSSSTNTMSANNNAKASSDASLVNPSSSDPFAPTLTDSAVGSSLLFPPSTSTSAYSSSSPQKGGGKSLITSSGLIKKGNNIGSSSVGGPSDPDQWSYRPSMLVFGGSNVSLGATYNDLWLFDVQCRAWKELSPLGTPPTPRWKSSGAALEQRMFIFGGETSSFDVVNELHMYDHLSGMWRELRIVEPCPRPRLGHACAVVGHKMIIAGGLDQQSYLDHVALMLQNASGKTGGVGSGMNSLNTSVGNKTSSDSDSVSDVWCLDMRTLLWRELATQDKKNSPFAIITPPSQRNTQVKSGSRRQSMTSEQGGRMRASSMSPARRESLAALVDDVTYGYMDGHVLLPFDDTVIVHGGTLNGKLNTRIFSLNVSNEHWSFHGEINTTSANSTNKLLKAQRLLQTGGLDALSEDPVAVISNGLERKPQPRAQHAGCAFVSKMALQSLGNFAALGNVSLSTGLAPGSFSTATTTVPTLGGGSTSASAGVSQHTVHMSQPKETMPLISQLAVPLAKQVSTRGLITVYKNKPVIHKTTQVFFFGGMSFPRSVTDMWALTLDIPVSQHHQQQHADDQTIGDRIHAATKAGVYGTTNQLGENILNMKAIGVSGGGGTGGGRGGGGADKMMMPINNGRTAASKEEEGTFARSQREPAPEYYFPALAVKNAEDLEVERLAEQQKQAKGGRHAAVTTTKGGAGGDQGAKKVAFSPVAEISRPTSRSGNNSPNSEAFNSDQSSSSDSDNEAKTAEESARKEGERMKRRMAALRQQIVEDAQAYILGSHYKPGQKSTNDSK